MGGGKGKLGWKKGTEKGIDCQWDCSNESVRTREREIEREGDQVSVKRWESRMDEKQEEIPLRD